MMSKKKRQRFVVIHGHFYQPPRENPWTEAIEKQMGAYPYHDWNEKIASECYNPNSVARVLSHDNKTIDHVNNYSYINFNYGPTLLNWYSRKFPEEYDRLLEADRISMQENDDHGNAIAQVYNHVIMPLANERDKKTQVIWGIEDFRYRFNRVPEAIWLPETACNDATVRVLIDSGMKYLILSPFQASRTRIMSGEEDKKEEWQDVGDGAIDPSRPYRLFYIDDDGKKNSEKYIDVFFYFGDLAQAVSFQKIMSESSGVADRFIGCFDNNRDWNQLIHIATDGETYGHHEAFAEMCLAHLTKYELPKRGVRVTNYATYLKDNPPTFEVEIKAGNNGEGTSWSCSHGVERWKSDCGCGKERGWHQNWRGPFRDALNWLRDVLSKIYEQEGSRYMRDVWEVRDRYIEVILDRSRTRNFLRNNLIVDMTGPVQIKVLKLLEMQRYSMMMFTSCGWFFSEISGIEAVQNLKYAARAVQLAQEITGRSLEHEFLNRLKAAKSNLPEFNDGWGVYDKLVRPSITTLEQVVSQYGICLLFDTGEQSENIYYYRIRTIDLQRQKIAGIELVVGRVIITSEITTEERDEVFFIVCLPDYTIRAYVKGFVSEDEYRDMKQKIFSISGEEILKGIDEFRKPFFEKKFYGLKDLFIEDRERIFSLIIKEKFEKLKAAYDSMLKEYLPIIEELSELGLPVPPDVKKAVNLAMSRQLAREIELFLDDFDMEHFRNLNELVSKAKRFGISLDTSLSEKDIKEIVEAKFNNLSSSLTIHNLLELKEIIDFCMRAGYFRWKYSAENSVFALLKEKIEPIIERMETFETPGRNRDLITAFLDMADSLNVNTLEYRELVEKNDKG